VSDRERTFSRFFGGQKRGKEEKKRSEGTSGWRRKKKRERRVFPLSREEEVNVGRKKERDPTNSCLNVGEEKNSRGSIIDYGRKKKKEARSKVPSFFSIKPK